MDSQQNSHRMHPLAERILAGEDVSMCEISEFNATWLMDWFRNGGHDTCNRKHCQHKAQPKEIEHAARLASHDYCCKD